MNEKTKDMLGLAARLILGGVFIYAGFLKTVAPAEEFAYAIEAYRVVPQGFALLSALTVPWLEIYLGVFLIAGLFGRLSAGLAGALLAGFAGLLLQALLRHLPITSCGCFGASKGNSPGYELFQNLLLLGLAALAFKYGKRISLDALLESHEKHE
ncbi:MAG: DoxX family protein [Elusimicrobia bacterium]|nr:DoxX family protein [Elusimicrobiota bacterium]